MKSTARTVGLCLVLGLMTNAPPVFAQTPTVCIATNLKAIDIDTVSKALPQPAASLEALTSCVSESLDGEVDPCGCSIVACSPVASFPTGATLASLLTRILKDAVDSATTPSRVCK